jgi:meiotic recombination protein SPO11
MIDKFKEQREVDDAIQGITEVYDTYIEDLTSLLRCKRLSLNICASVKGVVGGRLSFSDGVTAANTVGLPITDMLIEKIQSAESDAMCVLVIEKESVFHRLMEDEIYLALPSILVWYYSVLVTTYFKW